MFPFFQRIINSRLLPLGLILIGIFFRVCNYIDNTSLWLDEAWLARDVLSRSFKEIFFNIMTNKELPAIPPVGFQLIEKMMVTLFKNHEYILRFFPFLCGVLSVIAFWFLAKRVVNRAAALLALTFFGCNEMLIYYAAECKQYGGEVLAAIILYLTALHFQERPANFLRVLIFGVIGILAMGISHTAVLILGGIGLTQVVALKNAEERKSSLGYLISYLMWGVCFLAIYFVYLNHMYSQDSRMGKFVIQSSNAHFMPQPFFSGDALRWFWWSLTEYFKNVVQLVPAILAIGMCILGIVKGKIERRAVLMLALPFILMLVACGLKKFPFTGRFVLFLVPAVFILVAAGLTAFMRKNKILAVIGLIIYGIFFVPIITNAVQKVITPRKHEEIRPLMVFLSSHQLPGDGLYMNTSAQYAYMYYLQYFKFKFINPINGYFDDEIVEMSPFENSYIHYWFSSRTPFGDLFSRAEIQPKNPKVIYSGYRQRAWLLLSHITKNGSEKFVKEAFDSRGIQLEAVERPGSWLYLYELYEPIATIKEANKIYNPEKISEGVK
jgi:4-amino-4-deoxy-L-arabinose transferase-like glycosyltransferase